MAYQQLLKSKNKQQEVLVVKKADFIKLTNMNEQDISQFQYVICLNNKFLEIY